MIYQQIVDELTFSDADILQIKLMISFLCSGSGPQQCFGNQDLYMAQFLQCYVQPDGILNEVSAILKNSYLSSLIPSVKFTDPNNSLAPYLAPSLLFT